MPLALLACCIRTAKGMARLFVMGASDDGHLSHSRIGSRSSRLNLSTSYSVPLLPALGALLEHNRRLWSNLLKAATNMKNELQHDIADRNKANTEKQKKEK